MCESGSLPKRSTEHNLMYLMDYITSALNDGMYFIGVFLDLRKAFDVYSHPDGDRDGDGDGGWKIRGC